MKKKVVKRAVSSKTNKKATVKKTARPASRRRSSYETVTFVPVSFRRIVIWGPLVVLLFAVLFVFNRQQMTEAVAGTTIYKGMVAHYQATVQIPSIPGAVSYNIYYKQTGDTGYTNAVRKIPSTLHTYLISSLKNNVQYVYRISAVNTFGAESWWSPVYPLMNLQSM